MTDLAPTRTPRFEVRRWLRDAVASASPETCIEWPFNRHEAGYGRLRIDGRTRVATHIALELVGKPRPGRSMQALHSCDNPPCVNPHHLRWGTNRDNAVDRMERGPEVGRKGEAHSQARLTEADVLDIRRRYSRGGISMQRLADEYGLHDTTVFGIVHRRIWSHLSDEEARP